MSTEIDPFKNDIHFEINKSLVLILGTERPPTSTLEVDCLLTLDQGLEKLQHIQSLNNSVYDVIALPITFALDKKFISFWTANKLKTKTLLLIEIPESSRTEHLHKLISIYEKFYISENYLNLEFEDDLWKAVNESQKKKQNYQLEKIIHEQKESLQKLYSELEVRVEKRQKYLLEAIHKTESIKNRWFLLNQALTIIYQANSIADLQTQLSIFFKNHFYFERIYLITNNSFTDYTFKKENPSYRIPIELSDKTTLDLVVEKSVGNKITKDDLQLITPLTESIVLTIERIRNQNLSATIRKEWETTFNSIRLPLALISDDYQVLQFNKSFSSISELGGKCYQVFFHRKTPCLGCHLGKNSIIQNEDEKSFQLHSQKILLPSEKRQIYFHLYKDISEEKKIESKLIENTKMAELGTIGSSIAHELNNPLGGILSFVQLIKMDLPKESPLWPDILEMEKACLRSKDIIQNLLQFTRTPNKDSKESFLLNELILKAIQLQQLQAKSKNIQLRIQNSMPNCPMIGNASLVLQAIQNILHLWFEAVPPNLKQTAQYKLSLEISLIETKDKYEILFLDDTLNKPVSTDDYFIVNSNTWTSVSLDLTKKIIFEHGGKLDFMRDSGPFHGVKITFSRPVFS